MSTQLETLHGIHDLVKHSANPCAVMFPVSDLLIQSTLPYENVSADLTELQNSGCITMKHLSVTLIAITDVGLRLMKECICNKCMNYRTLYLKTTA